MKQRVGSSERDEREEAFYARVDPSVGLHSAARPQGAEIVELIAPVARPRTDRRRTTPRLAAFGAVSSLAAVLLVAALAPHGQARPAQSLALASPRTTPGVAVTPKPTPEPTIELARGVTIRATGSALAVVPSPAGASVAVIDRVGPGSISVSAADGHPIASFDGTELAWLDEDTVLVYSPGGVDPSIGIVTRWTLAGKSGGQKGEQIPGSYGGIVGSAGGMFAALLDPGQANSATAPGFLVYSAAEGLPNGYEAGVPVAWSATDGLLAVWQPPAGIVTDQKGGLGTITVRREPGGRSTPVTDYVALEQGISFSPDGTYLAGEGPSSAPFVVEIATGNATPFGNNLAFAAWTSNSRVVLQGPDNSLSIWAPDGSMTEVGQRQSGTLVYGPQPDELATVTSAPSGPGSIVTVRMHSMSVTLTTRGAATATWLPAGDACLVTGGSDDSQRARDVLYRVQLLP